MESSEGWHGEAYHYDKEEENGVCHGGEGDGYLLTAKGTIVSFSYL